MSWPYTHLLINHFPVVLTIAALAAGCLALVLNRRGLWQTAMAAMAAAALSVYPVYFTGNEADQALNDPWYIKHGVIDAHDTAAGIALWAILIVGVFAAYWLWRSIKRPAEQVPGWVRAAVFIGSLAAVGTVSYTAYLGGKIVHDSPVLQMKQAPAGLPPAVSAELADSAGR